MSSCRQLQFGHVPPRRAWEWAEYHRLIGLGRTYAVAQPAYDDIWRNYSGFVVLDPPLAPAVELRWWTIKKLGNPTFSRCLHEHWRDGWVALDHSLDEFMAVPAGTTLPKLFKHPQKLSKRRRTRAGRHHFRPELIKKLTSAADAAAPLSLRPRSTVERRSAVRSAIPNPASPALHTPSSYILLSIGEVTDTVLRGELASGL